VYFSSSRIAGANYSASASADEVGNVQETDRLLAREREPEAFGAFGFGSVSTTTSSPSDTAGK